MEYVDLFDKNRISLNMTKERFECVPDSYTQVVHVWIKNDKGEFLIQKRSMKKKAFPGKWSVTGGGVESGETPLNAAIRECKEEIGIDIILENIELLMTIKRQDIFMDIFLAHQSFSIEDVELEENEVDEVKWATEKEIRKLMKEDKVGESMMIYFNTLCKLIERNKKIILY